MQLCISERCLLHRFVNLYPMTGTLNLHFYYTNLPFHFTTFNLLFALGLFAFCASNSAVRKTSIVHP